MSSQDRLENVLRDFHVMISKSEVYDTERIIVSKNLVFDLIDRLNACVYEIMDEYEMTQQSRDKALREHKKEGDKIIWDASRQAEDIYAASVMYTQEALNRLNRVVDEANMTISHLYREFGDSMKQQQETIRENELELKSQLQLLSDTEKYMSLIEERNREIEREEAEKTGRKLGHTTEKAAVKPEIKINEEYFRKAGIPLDGYVEKEPVKEEEVQPLIDEGVVEASYKKADVPASQKTASQGALSGQGAAGQKMPGQEITSQGLANEEITMQEEIGQGMSGQENVQAEYVSQEYTGQENVQVGYVSQEYAGTDMSDQEYVGQEYANQGMLGQEYMPENTAGQEIETDDLALEENKKDSKGELSFFDKLMGKKNS